MQLVIGQSLKMRAGGRGGGEEDNKVMRETVVRNTCFG